MSLCPSAGVLFFLRSAKPQLVSDYEVPDEHLHISGSFQRRGYWFVFQAGGHLASTWKEGETLSERASFSMGGESALLALPWSEKVARAGIDIWAKLARLPCIGRIDTMSSWSEASKPPSTLHALMMILSEPFAGSMIPAKIVASPVSPRQH